MQNEQKFKSYVKKFVSSKSIKLVGDGRGDYHIRFPLKGNLEDFNNFFKEIDIQVIDSAKSVSSKYKGYVLIAMKDMDSFKKDTKLEWVNSEISESNTGSKLFAPKDLSPDKLQVVGIPCKVIELIEKVSIEINKKYDKSISKQLISLLKASKEKKELIELNEILLFEKDDLKTISKDFGEILSAIWLMSKFNFSQVVFPNNSNEKFIDFFC